MLWVSFAFTGKYYQKDVFEPHRDLAVHFTVFGPIIALITLYPITTD